jgi:hypothetical protein
LEGKRTRRLRGIAAVRSLGRRGRALLGTAIATALLLTISPLVAGPAHAATVASPIPATGAVLAAHANPGSEPDSVGCKVSGPMADPGQLALTRAMGAARAAGLSVSTQQRTGDGTSTVTYAISSGATAASPAVAAKAPKTWWVYITYKHALCSTISYFWYDFSANMTKDIVKAAAKAATKVSVYLNALAAILALVLSNGKVGAIIAIVSAILGVVGMNLKKWYKVIKKYTVGNGKRAGFDSEVMETAIDNYYEGDAARSCATGWWTLKCGSPNHLWPKDQI